MPSKAPDVENVLGDGVGGGLVGDGAGLLLDAGLAVEDEELSKFSASMASPISRQLYQPLVVVQSHTQPSAKANGKSHYQKPE